MALRVIAEVVPLEDEHMDFSTPIENLGVWRILPGNHEIRVETLPLNLLAPHLEERF